MKEIYILGVGHNTTNFIELAELCGYIVKGIYHYENGRTGELILNFPIVGTSDELFMANDLSESFFALSMGDNKIRVELARKIRERGGVIPTLIHPTAVVSKYATIEEGVIIHANSTILPDTIIKSDSIISFNVGISHNVIIEKGCYISGQSIVGSYAHIHEQVLVGIGAVIVSGKVACIGRNAVIGGGSVVLKSVEENSVVFGSPAK